MNAKSVTDPNCNGSRVPACCPCPSHELNLCHALLRLTGDDGAAAFQPREQTIAARRMIGRENMPLDGVPVICRGWAANALTLPDGRRQILSILLPGDIASALLIYDPVSRCSIEAITKVSYRTFARDDIKAALLRHPGLFDMVCRIRSDEMTRDAQLAVDLGRRTATERIAQLIVNLAERLTQRGMMADGTMDFPLRQHHIADAAGLTVVHAGNVLAEFRRAGLIEINDRSLTLLDPDGLRRIAGAY